MVEILKKLPWRKTARIPKGLRIYAIGDVHGQSDALRDVFTRIDSDLKQRSAARSVVVGSP